MGIFKFQPRMVILEKIFQKSHFFRHPVQYLWGESFHKNQPESFRFCSSIKSSRRVRTSYRVLRRSFWQVQMRKAIISRMARMAKNRWLRQTQIWKRRQPYFVVFHALRVMEVVRRGRVLRACTGRVCFRAWTCRASGILSVWGRRSRISQLRVDEETVWYLDFS